MKIAPGLKRKLQREAREADSKDFEDVLIAEALARREFLELGLPCWRTNQKPSDRGRYSLVFPSGRRAAVTPIGRNRISFDTLAAAKCHYVIAMRMESELSGEMEGYFSIFDIRKPGNVRWRPRLDELELRSIDEFPELKDRPASFRLSYFLGSLKLLLLGDLPVVGPDS
ncbi:MAG: hypothetical protein GF388_02485, partial [Candidatus Aegiribacteria sp.]|nr:hypothetical protein [Candidatus Aegiribacteria sp.]MBD3294175.1 hypothetical protein [Candidatus Fermentibacteria bacterium]